MAPLRLETQGHTIAMRSRSICTLILGATLVMGLSACDQRPATVGGGASAASAANEAVIRHYVALINSHQYEGLRDVLAADFKLHLGNEVLDRDQTIEISKSVFESFPDFNHTIEDVFSSGDRVALRVIDRGTQAGAFQGIAASGRKIEIGQISIYRMVDGRIAEVWEQADLAGLLQQIRAPASTGEKAREDTAN